jgi:hypothetical protein
MLSRFIHHVAHTPPQIISRFLKGMAALMPPMPDSSCRGFSRNHQTLPVTSAPIGHESRTARPLNGTSTM